MHRDAINCIFLSALRSFQNSVVPEVQEEKSAEYLETEKPKIMDLNDTSDDENNNVPLSKVLGPDISNIDRYLKFSNNFNNNVRIIVV